MVKQAELHSSMVCNRGIAGGSECTAFLNININGWRLTSLFRPLRQQVNGLPSLQPLQLYSLQMKLNENYHDVFNQYISTRSLLNMYDNILGYVM